MIERLVTTTQRISNKYVVSVWKTLFCALCSETLAKNSKHNNNINGIEDSNGNVIQLDENEDIDEEDK